MQTYVVEGELPQGLLGSYKLCPYYNASPRPVVLGFVAEITVEGKAIETFICNFGASNTLM